MMKRATFNLLGVSIVALGASAGASAGDLNPDQVFAQAGVARRSPTLTAGAGRNSGWRRASIPSAQFAAVHRRYAGDARRSPEVS